MTPEGKVKADIKKTLESLGIIAAKDAVNATAVHTGKYVMPVPTGRGVAGIPDFYGHYKGRFFEIEAKDEGKEPTALQRHQLDATRVTGAMAFVVDRVGGMGEFLAWAGRK